VVLIRRPFEPSTASSAVRWVLALPLAYLAAAALWSAVVLVCGLRVPEDAELLRRYPGRVVGNVVSGMTIPAVAAYVVYFDRVSASALSAGSVLVIALLTGAFASGGGTWVDLASAFGPAVWTAYGIRRADEYRDLN
jgi:hypothetical protein